MKLTDEEITKLLHNLSLQAESIQVLKEHLGNIKEHLDNLEDILSRPETYQRQ